MFARLLPATLVGVLLAAAGICAAQTGPQPQLKPGDRWDFVVWYATPSATPNRRWVVKSVTSTLVTAEEDGQPLLLSPQLNPIESPIVKQSNSQMLRFPLQVGQRWDYVNDVVFKDNGSTGRVHNSAAVVAYERVRVPAGEFDAFKLEASGRVQGKSKGGPGIIDGESRSTYWYAPAARAIVKMEYRNTYRGSATTELVAFELQP
jgi:hypothetical protein